MKILLVHNFYRTSAPSGEDIVVRNEAAMLSKHCEVITYFRQNDDLDDSTFNARVGIAANAVWSISSFRNVLSLIEQHRPAVMHVHNTFPQISPSVYAAAKMKGVPVVQTLHNYRIRCANGLLLREGRPCELCLSGTPIPALRNKCYRQSTAATATVVAIQTANGLVGSYRKNVDTYIALTGFAKLKMQSGDLRDCRFVIKPNFLPAPPEAGPYPRLRQAIFVGRLTEEKGIMVLLRAWPRHEGFKLVVVGDGALRSSLEAYAAEEGLDVSFLGHCDRATVLKLLRESALQIIPSVWYEGFPMVVLEAYACGTAVLASRLGGLAEAVEDGRTGRLFAAGNVEELRSLIVAMLNGDETDRLGMEGRKVFESRYTEEQNIGQLLAIYEDARKTEAGVLTHE